MRLDTSAIRTTSGGKQGQQFALCEVLAYGTAVKASADTNRYGMTYNAASGRT